MARARNIKPAFFDNDELADNDPLGRLLFIGLWTIADCNGNLEWRSKRVKKQLLAYDECCIDSLAINLDKSGFVRFYSDGDKIYLNVINFDKHQNPHKNEKAKGTEIPEYCEEYRQAIDLNKLAINRDLSGLKQNCSDSNPADSLNLIPDSLNLIPDSLNLIPDSLNLIPDTLNLIPDTVTEQKTSPAKAGNDVLEIFNYWKEVMKKGGTTRLNKKREKLISDRLKEGYQVDEFKTAIFNCSMSPFHMGQNDNQTKYNDIELICRPDKFEQFRDNVGQQAQPRQMSKATERTFNNIIDVELD